MSITGKNEGLCYLADLRKGGDMRFLKLKAFFMFMELHVSQPANPYTLSALHPIFSRSIL
jgi:hypothetical protein